MMAVNKRPWAWGDWWGGLLPKSNPAKPNTGEGTSAQVSSGASSTELYRDEKASYTTYRMMRKDPTIFLARSLIIGAIMSSSWSVTSKDDTPDEVVQEILDSFLPMRWDFLFSLLQGCIDFGWQPYEKVFDVDESGRTRLTRLKPLLQDLTTILIIPNTGEFAGFQQSTATASFVQLPPENCVLATFNQEGGYLYGASLLENSRHVFNKWEECDKGASRYDRKIAGAHFVVYYPPSTSLYNSTTMTNYDIAVSIVNSLEASGPVAVPTVISGTLDGLNEQTPGWKIELLEDKGGRQASFVDREKYLDALKVRGLGIPERAVLEGQFGTKAEAGVHGDLAMLTIGLIDLFGVRVMNEQVVGPYLRMNYGKDAVGSVVFTCAPLSAERIGRIGAVLDKVLSGPNANELFGQIDWDAVLDETQIPKAKEVVDVEENDDDKAPAAPVSDAEKVAGINGQSQEEKKNGSQA